MVAVPLKVVAVIVFVDGLRVTPLANRAVLVDVAVWLAVAVVRSGYAALVVVTVCVTFVSVLLSLGKVIVCVEAAVTRPFASTVT